MNRRRLLALEGANAWIALLAVWAGMVAAGFYFRSVDTAIRHFKGRIIGHAVTFGLDPALRIRAYVILCAVALGTAAVVILCLYHLRAWARARGTVLLSRSEQRAASLLALVGMGDLTLYVLTAAPAYRNGTAFLLLCTMLLAAAPVIRLLAQHLARFRRMQALGSPWAQGGIVLLAYQLSVGAGVLMGSPLMLGPAALGRFVFAWLLLQAAAGAVTVRHGGGPDAGIATQRLLRACLPLLWLPAVGPLANELQFTLRTHIAWTPQALAGVAALGLVALATGRWRRTPQPPVSAHGTQHLVQRWYVPVVLVSSTLLSLHRQTMTIATVDVFHHGEMTTPVLEILRQGRLPYLEFCLPHGLMDVVPQVLFGILNGADRWDILIWGSGHFAGWLTLTTGLALLYALLVTEVSPLAALLLLLFLPSEVLFSCLNAPVIISVLALRVFLKNGGSHRAWVLPASLLAVFLWRVDFGVAVLVASAAVLLTVRWSGPRVRWLPLLLASSVMLTGACALATTLAAVRGVSVGNAVHNFLAYISMQVAVASYLKVYDEMSPVVVLQYLFLPAIGLLIVLHYGVRAVLLRQCAPVRVHSLAFLTVVSLVLFVRSLQRHSLVEGIFSPYVFLYLLAMVPVLLRPQRRALVPASLVVVAVGAVFVLPDTRTLPKDVKWPVIAGGPSHFAFRTWSGTDQRVLVRDPATDDVVRLLRAELKPGQTFYDFSNAPLLYFLTGTVPPAYILEPTYHVSDDVQLGVIRDLETLRRAERLPLVVFKQHTAFDAVDGIPNEVRSYRIVEYVYAHYVPWTNAGRFEIWIEKTQAAQARPPDTGLEGAVVARYPLPLQAPNVTAHMVVRTGQAGELTLTSLGDPAWVEGAFVLPEEVAWTPGLEFHLHLLYTTSAPGVLQAIFSFANPAGPTTTSAEVIAAPSTDGHPMDVHLPLRLGTTQPPALTGVRLVLPPAATVTLQTAELEVRQRPGNAAEAWVRSPVSEPYPQHFDLSRLPYVWANFDDHDPLHTCAEQQALQTSGPVDAAAGQALEFALQPTSMPSGQYLHLQLQTESAGTVSVSYGDARHSNSWSMLVQAAAEPQDYLIRTSTQWEWYRGTVTALRLSSTAPMRVNVVRLLAGD